MCTIVLNYFKIALCLLVFIFPHLLTEISKHSDTQSWWYSESVSWLTSILKIGKHSGISSFGGHLSLNCFLETFLLCFYNSFKLLNISCTACLSVCLLPYILTKNRPTQWYLHFLMECLFDFLNIFQDICTLVQNDYKFLLCLSVRFLAHCHDENCYISIYEW